MNEVPRLPINQENLDRLTESMWRMADAASIAARRAEPVLRRAAEQMARRATPVPTPDDAEGKG